MENLILYRDQTRMIMIMSEKNREDMICGDAAIRLYYLLKNPPKNALREYIIRMALEMFPDPTKKVRLDIDVD